MPSAPQSVTSHALVCDLSCLRRPSLLPSFHFATTRNPEPVTSPQHDTPALRHLDVSYHGTGSAVAPGSGTAFLMQPSWDAVTGAIR